MKVDCRDAGAGSILPMAFNGQQYDLPTELLPPEVGTAEQQQSAADSGPAPSSEDGLQLTAQGDQRFDVLTHGMRALQDTGSQPAQQLTSQGLEEQQ